MRRNMSNTVVLAAVFLFGVLALMSSVSAAYKPCEPRQIRLLMGEDFANTRSDSEALLNSSLTLIFQTTSECTDAFVETTINGVEGSKTKYSVSERVHSKWDGEQFCHHGKECENVYYDEYVQVFRLWIPHDTAFSYTVGGDSSSSGNAAIVRGPFESKVPSKDGPVEGKPQRILFYGDQDQTDDGLVTFGRWRELKKASAENAALQVDSMMFLGDYAYEFYTNNGKRGDAYLEAIEEFTTRWPIAMQAGNHEDNYKFKFYNQKFRMMNFNETSNNYFSYNQGLAHFVGVNLHFYSDWATPEEKTAMLDWVRQDLENANVNREQVPWIIVFGHKPIYCAFDSDCPSYPVTFADFDALFYEQSVDIFLGAHVHNYQFMRPLYKNQLKGFSGSDLHMVNPQGMIQVIQGNGGHILESAEDVQQAIKFLGQTDKRAAEVKFFVGYGILEIYNSTTVCMQSFRSKEGKIESTHCVTSEHHNFHTESSSEQSVLPAIFETKTAPSMNAVIAQYILIALTMLASVYTILQVISSQNSLTAIE